MRNEVDEVQVQVLREQSPPPVLDIKDQEDDSNPNLVSATPVDEDQVGQPDDNVNQEDQVSRKQLDPPSQEPSGSVPDTTIRPKEQTGGKGSFVSVRGVKVTGPGGRGGISRRGGVSASEAVLHIIFFVWYPIGFPRNLSYKTQDCLYKKMRQKSQYRMCFFDCLIHKTMDSKITCQNHS